MATKLRSLFGNEDSFVHSDLLKAIFKKFYSHLSVFNKLSLHYLRFVTRLLKKYEFKEKINQY